MRLVRLSVAVFCVTVWAADYGLPVGSKMPAFSLPDQNGATRSLNDIMGPNGAAIVFFRSADW